jgi:hypothetical protein
MKCSLFFAFAVPKFGCLLKSAYFCPLLKDKIEMPLGQVTDISALESEIDRLVYQQPVKRRWL